MTSMLWIVLSAAASAPTFTPAPIIANGLLPPLPVPLDNPQSDAKVQLGRQLYFDPRLSADNTISCATCHAPETGWANHHPTDTGIRGQVGTRNSGAVLDAAFMRYQFWDGRAGSLEEQALGPIHNPVEMGETLENVVRKLNAVAGYREQFRKVFNTGVTVEGIAKAIGAFERTVVGGPSPYDRYLTGERDVLTPAALRGMELFSGKARCTGCHGGPAFSDQWFHNVGVGMSRPNPDLGREVVTKDPNDRGRFKTPGLRNVARTYPYMHDGSVPTLRAVIELYDRGGERNANLDPFIVPLGLSPGEITDLLAFLEALSGTLPAITAPPLPGMESTKGK